MTAYNPGDVILVPFPFAERAGGRKRPALVVSPHHHNEETSQILIAQITSRVSSAPRPGDSPIQDWKTANLPRPALVRARFATIDSSLVLRKLGALTETDLQTAQTNLRSVFP